MTQLILASASPRRKALLTAMGVEFEVHVTHTDETRRDNELAEDFVARLAREKALQAVSDLSLSVNAPTAVLAADTVVVQAGNIFGKPKDYDHAVRIWHALSGNRHQVMTGVCLWFAGNTWVRVCITDVEFGRITEAQMARYWASGEPQDKAGAYGIQGLASAWVKQLSGSYTNIVGLPLREVNQLLTEIELNWL